MEKLIVVAVIVLLLTGFAGCGQDASSEEKDPVTAMSIDDNAPNFYEDQIECPVCGGQPINAEYYVDAVRGRVYFDKKECMEKFKEDQAKYIQEWLQRIDERRMQEQEEEEEPTTSQ